MRSKILGEEKFLKKIQEFIPTHFEDLNTKHTLFISPTIRHSNWSGFNKLEGVSTKSKDFIGLEIRINECKVEFSVPTRHYFSYPNKTYMGYGHKDNKHGLLIELPEKTWGEIKTNGYFDLSIEWELSPATKQKPFVPKKTFIENREEDIEVSYASIHAKVNVKNINNGQHLALRGFYESKMCCYFEKDFQEKTPLHHEGVIKKIYYPRDTDLKEYMWWSYSQNMELEIEPYNIYDVSARGDYESFCFSGINYCTEKENSTHNEDEFKIIGTVDLNSKLNMETT